MSAPGGERDGVLRWCFNCSAWQPSETEWRDVMAAFPESEERERIDKFVFRRDAKLSLIGRLLMRRACALVAGVGGEALAFGRTAENKPYLKLAGLAGALPSSWNFNVSHDGDWVVLAAQPGLLVGVDVACSELRRGRQTADEFLDVMQSVMLPSEWRHIRSFAEPLRQFAKYWALKEAYIKAVGVGFGVEPHELEFVAEPAGGHRLFRQGVEQSGWQFRLHDLDAAHVVACALGPVADALPSYGQLLPPAGDQCGAHEEPDFRVVALDELLETL